MWEPWRGALYNARRLLILGESCYDWEEDGARHHPKPDHPINLVKTQLVEPFERIPFMTTLTRSVTGKKDPTLEDREEGWRSVGFTNFVPCSVGYGPRVRPGQAMWHQGVEEFRPMLLETLRPRNVIVLGIELWRHLPPADISLNEDSAVNAGSATSVTESMRGYRLSDGSMARFWCHWHPSSGGSWTSIRDAIAKAEATPELDDQD